MDFHDLPQQADRFPGRLEPKTEAMLKEYFLNGLNSTRKKRPLNSALINEYLKDGQYLMGFNDDHPLCVRLQDFLASSVMKDDPAYRHQQLVAGDTIAERYEAYVRFYREAIKQWALYGIQYQLGSSAYTYKTYPHYFNFLELTPDPVIRKRTRMYLDLIMVESAQISDFRPARRNQRPGQVYPLGSDSGPALWRARQFVLPDDAGGHYQPPEPAKAN